MRPALLLYQDRIKTLQEKKTQTNISQEQRRKNLQQDVNKSDPTSYSENYARQLSGVNPSHARLVQQLKINQCNPPHQWAKNKPIISTAEEKALDKVQLTFLIKALREMGTVGNILCSLDHLKIPLPDITLQG